MPSVKKSGSTERDERTIPTTKTPPALHHPHQRGLIQTAAVDTPSAVSAIMPPTPRVSRIICGP